MSMLRGCSARLKSLDDRKRIVVTSVLAILAMVALAGCMGIGSGGGQSLSDAGVQTTEDGPAVVFNYSVNDYSTVLLEGPDDNIVNQKEISPDGERSGLFMYEPRSGEYELVLRQGENTISTKTLTFDGANPEIEDVSPQWSGNKIEYVAVTVRNDGDLPAYVDNASFSARGDSVESSVYEWLEAGNSTTLNVSTSYGGTVSIEEPGDVRGDVQVVTDSGRLTGSFSKTFEGPNLKIVSANGIWNQNTLETVDVTVRNEGDLPTRANVTVERAGEALGGAVGKQIPVGSTVSFEATALGYIYQADSGGTVSLDVVVNSPSGFTTDQIQHEVEGANITLESISSAWEQGKLQSVSFTASNNGEVAIDTTVELTVNGEVVAESPYSLEASSTEAAKVGDNWGYSTLYTVTEGGTYDVTLTLDGPDGSVSKSTTATFEGPNAEVSSVSSTFFSNYNENTSYLSSVDFRVRNTGDVMLTYDSVEVSMDGVSQTDSTYTGTELEPGQSSTEYRSYDLTVSDGRHEMTIRLLDDGETVATETVTISTSD